MQQLLLHSLVCGICCAAVHESDSDSVRFNGRLLFQISSRLGKIAKYGQHFVYALK
jgi:hypothetical protein